jgi:ketosteroid isomerase-like protein
MRSRVLILTAFFVAASHATLAAQSTQAAPADTTSPVAVVQRLFDAMARGDSATLRALLVPGMHFVALSADAAAPAAPRMQADTTFIQSLGRQRQRLLERMWEPVVRVQGSIATVWAPYDFHIDGKFSHCGVDTATLLRTARGWQIATLAYTVQRTGCAPSPLGPPR